MPRASHAALIRVLRAPSTALQCCKTLRSRRKILQLHKLNVVRPENLNSKLDCARAKSQVSQHSRCMVLRRFLGRHSSLGGCQFKSLPSPSSVRCCPRVIDPFSYRLGWSKAGRSLGCGSYCCTWRDHRSRLYRIPISRQRDLAQTIKVIQGGILHKHTGLAILGGRPVVRRLVPVQKACTL